MTAPLPALHLLIVDDHPVVRLGMAQLLRAQREGCEVSEADSLPAALALLALRPDVALVVLDVHLPGLAPLQALRQLRADWPLLPVLLMSADTDPALALRALDEGASGWLPKSADVGVLLGALELVLAGGCYLPPFLLQRGAETPPDEALTQRQAEVLAELVKGRSNKEIARELGMSEPTVKGHLVTIFRVLRVRNRAEAALAGQARLASMRF
ncbi:MULTISPECIES: response regulator [Roseateles]|uniref:Response regulator transcription factor n=1 Tax=Pelomonas caseinilytica TaxID=2906763 RepID=A0ABS8XBI1_9BURK|nr:MULTISPECIES: response regulator transcription factor [unclassified Roseateles]MCE4536337.1 response regulator transcription factor [Pelomonas sp. P7]HEV6966953.1 response regulator transcription factor [Roseateles sp.]